MKKVHELISACARRTPEKNAVIYKGESISYQQLEERADKLANALWSMGIEDGVPVAICMQRSIDTVVAMLGVMKSGGHYLVLDLDYPRSSLQMMLKKSAVGFLVSDLSSQSREFTNSCDIPLCIISVKGEYIAGNRCNALPVSRWHGTAFIVFTSGTTGVPKGVITSNRALSIYQQKLSKRLSISPQDCYLHTASFAFSSSNRQVFLSLCMGACLVVATPEQKVNAAELLQLIEDQCVTIIDLVPTHYQAIFSALELSKRTYSSNHNHRLRLLLSASEFLSPSLPERARHLFGPDFKFINMYGLTEATGIVATQNCLSKSGLRPTQYPIGQPLEAVSFFILDKELQPVIVGAVGDLYIESEQLAEGYLDDTGATEESFIEYKTASAKRRLLYTGDRVRLEPDGKIFYAGREDEQLKLNGIRIETQEIELALLKHPLIEETAVVKWEQGSHEYLLAFLVISHEMEFKLGELVEWLKDVLPRQYIPSGYQKLPCLPRNINGKINRSALVDEVGKYIIPEGYSSISTALIEDRIRAIWQQLFLQEVTPDVDFFYIGGNSLLAARMVSVLGNEYGIDIKVTDIFKHPTVKSLSHFIDGMDTSTELLIDKNKRKTGRV